jgi:cytochrome c553
VAWAKGEEGYGAERFAGVDEKGLTVDPTGAGAEINLCAGCHSRRQPLTAGSPAPSAPFLDHYVPALLREGLYHADGQILDEVYVYGSFLQSRMYAAGVSCGDCHEPHGLGTRPQLPCFLRPMTDNQTGYDCKF